jgi:serine/threonine-protein kinase
VGLYIMNERSGAAGDPEVPALQSEVDGLGAAAWTARLLAAPAARDWKGGEKALSALAQLDPAALRGAEVAKATTALALGAARARDASSSADAIFTLLANRFGSEGIDVLYGVAETKGAPEASKRAMALLRLPATLERSTPALRIAIELRDAPCEQKEALFARALSDGDKRALDALTALKTTACRSVKDPCCFATSKPLASAIKELGARLKK